MKGLRFMMLSLFTAFLTHAVPVQAQSDSFPSKPITIVIPLAVGGSSDLTARVWMPALTEGLGRPIVLDYKPGAGGNIGAAYVAKAAPDGYTLLLITATFTMLPAVANLPFDAVNDFAPVSLLSRRTHVLVVTPSLPVNSFPEFLAYVKAHPGELNWGTSGEGTSFHLAGALLSSATGAKVTFIHYKGSAQSYLDLAAGRLHVSPMSIFSALPFIRSGKVRVIAQLPIQRSPFMPDVPTIAEMGVPGYDHSTWQALLTSAGTPTAVVQKLNGPIAAYAKSPAALSMAAKVGDELVGSTPGFLGKLIVEEVARWKKVVRENNIRLEE